MGVTEWPGGQWITAKVYCSNEASNSKLLLIGQGMQMAFFNKLNKIKRANQISPTVVLKVHSIRTVFLLNHPLWWHYENSSVCYVTNNIVVHESQFCIILSCITSKKYSNLFWHIAYFPCINNCWTVPRGLQKIVYFNSGLTCRKVWEPLVWRCSLWRFTIFTCTIFWGCTYDKTIFNHNTKFKVVSDDRSQNRCKH